jgi:hypothetical protein
MKQILWLDMYEKDFSQVYFIIKDKFLNKIGTVRLYDIKNKSFSWGSWIIKDGSPFYYAIESALIVYSFAKFLGFTEAHFEVRKKNESVWKFHESFGAQRYRSSNNNFYYKINSYSIENSLNKYKKFLPNNINVVLEDKDSILN